MILRISRLMFAPHRAWYLGCTLAALASSTPANAQRLIVKELWRTNGDPETILFMGITGMAEATDGSVWLSDGPASQVLALDSALVPRLVARRGDGPGEFRGPSQMARTPANGLAIYDILRGSIEVFNPSGEFERRITLRARAVNSKGFVVLPTGEFILSGGIPGAGWTRREDIMEGEHSIHRFSRTGELIQSWWPIRETKNPRAGWMVAGGPVAVLTDGSLLFTDASPHQILRFSADGAEHRLLAADPKLLKAIGDEFITIHGSGPSASTTFDWNFPQSRLVGLLPSGELLNVVEFHEAGRTLFQLYTSAGAPLTQTWVDTAYNAFSLTRNGDILARWTDPDTYEDYVVRLMVEYRH